MFNETFKQQIATQLNEIRAAGLFKAERIITSPQRAHISTTTRPDVLNMCANNYLGLASDPAVVQAARETLEHWGYGLASVRFICGTQSLHKTLEEKLSEFLDTDDTIRSEEHTSELQSRRDLVCRLLL